MKNQVNDAVPRGLKAMIKRRSAVEPTIAERKIDGKLGKTDSTAQWVLPCTQCFATSVKTSGASPSIGNLAGRRVRVIEKWN